MARQSTIQETHSRLNSRSRFNWYPIENRWNSAINSWLETGLHGTTFTWSWILGTELRVDAIELQRDVHEVDGVGSKLDGSGTRCILEISEYVTRTWQTIKLIKNNKSYRICWSVQFTYRWWFRRSLKFENYIN